MPALIDSKIDLNDKLTSAWFIGTFLWLVDHCLTYLSSSVGSFSKVGQLEWGLAFLFAAIFVPFWGCRRIFQTALWRNVPHDPADRILVVVAGVTFQLSVDVFLLHWVSPGKLAMSFLYLFICSFGAVSDYRRHVYSKQSFSPQALPPEQELTEIRNRIKIASSLIVFCLFTGKFLLRGKFLGATNQIAYLVILTLGIIIPAVMFKSAHLRCPRCGEKFKLPTDTCKKCSLG